MNSELLSISMAENGYLVRVCGREKDEPSPEKDKSRMDSYHDPELYVVKTLGELTTFINEKLPNLIPYDADEEYATAFAKEVKNEHPE